MSTFSTVPLRSLVDAGQWQAEDLAGRLGIVSHAAFLRAGFVPYGDEPSSGHLLKQVDGIGPRAPSLSRRYTAAELARRREGAAEAAVLELRARGDGDVAFQVHLLTRDGDWVRSCQALLDEATLAPLLSGCLADATRALETGSAGAWLWKSLADLVLPDMLLELRRRNGLPVTCFASLPDDAKAEILRRLADGKDLARVECTSRQLRRLVAERGGELWKAMYESLDLLPEAQSSEDGVVGSWKETYVNAWQQLLPRRRLWDWFLQPYLFDSDDEDEWLLNRRAQRGLHEPDLQAAMLRVSWHVEDSFIFAPIGPMAFSLRDPPAPAPAPAPKVVARVKNAGGQHRDASRNDYKKKGRHGAGAIHSPSSRYRWKHR